MFSEDRRSIQAIGTDPTGDHQKIAYRKLRITLIFKKLVTQTTARVSDPNFEGNQHQTRTRRRIKSR